MSTQEVVLHKVVIKLIRKNIAEKTQQLARTNELQIAATLQDEILRLTGIVELFERAQEDHNLDQVRSDLLLVIDDDLF